MKNRRQFRPTMIDRLEDRLVLSQGVVAPSLVTVLTPVAGSVQAQNLAYVKSLYAYVGETPSSAGLTYHTAELNNGALSRYQLAQAFLRTTAFKNVETTDLFNLLLNRAPTTAELKYYAQNNNGTTHSLAIEAEQIIGSAEYFSLAGGTNAGFIARAYRNIFARDVDAGSQFWINALSKGVSRQQVAADLLQSPEGATNLVDIAYQQTLLRAPDSGSSVYVKALQGGTTYENVLASLLASPEFYAASQTRVFV